MELNKEIKEEKEPILELPFCACGCGGRVTKPGNKYIRGHHARVDHPMKGKHHSKKSKEKTKRDKKT